MHIHGIEIRDHLLVSDLRNQITKGSISTFSSDQMGIFIGTRIAERLNLQIEDRVNIVGKIVVSNSEFLVFSKLVLVILIKKEFIFLYQLQGPWQVKNMAGPFYK